MSWANATMATAISLGSNLVIATVLLAAEPSPAAQPQPPTAGATHGATATDRLTTRLALEAALTAAHFTCQPAAAPPDNDTRWIKADGTLGEANRLATRLGLEPLSDPFSSTPQNHLLTTFGAGVTITADLTKSTVAKDGTNPAAPATLKVEINWRFLPTSACLIEPPNNTHHREYQKILRDSGFTTTDGEYFENHKITYEDAVSIAKRIGAVDPEAFPCIGAGSIAESWKGKGQYLLIQGSRSPFENGSADSKTVVSVVANLNQVPMFPSKESADAPAPTRELAHKMLLQCQFKEQPQGTFTSQHVRSVHSVLVLRAVGIPELEIVSRPAQGQAGEEILTASNPKLGVKVRAVVKIYITPHKPGSFLYDEMCVVFETPSANP